MKIYDGKNERKAEKINSILKLNFTDIKIKNVIMNNVNPSNEEIFA